MSNSKHFNTILFKSLPIGLALTRMDGSIVEINPAFAQIVGRTNDEIKKSSYWDLTPSDYDEQEQKQLTILHKTGQYGPYEKEYYHIDGHRVPVRLQGRIVCHNDEDLIWSSVEDISETKLAERDIKRFKATLDETLDCVFMFKLQPLQFFYVNQGAISQLGYDADELMKMTPFDIKPEVNESQFRDIIAPLISGEKRKIMFETIHQHKDGHKIPVEIFLQYFHLPNEDSHFIATVRDITERKLTEQILMSSNAELEERVQQRTAEYYQAKNEAEKANRAKSQFLSSISHELRTPLNAIIGFSQLLEMREKDEDKREDIQEIIVGGNHLLELIDEILDLAQIESGNVNLSIKKHSLNIIIIDSLSMIKILADKHAIHIDDKVSSLPEININVDELRFKQVLLNLLSNAIKYNSEKGKVIIECLSKDNSMLCLSITDTGKGFTVEQLNHLFEPFERFGAENSKIEGTGLGLVITKDLIELMGGKITVESVLGKGSRFIIHVPLF
ncbi:MAG: PAS domain-containing sensor histidine kinase [Woeseiaceae bacterium]